MEKIYKTTVCQFETKQVTELRIFFEYTNPREILCIRYLDDMVDIETGEKYHLLKKDKNNFILPEEEANIDFEQKYAIYIRDYNKQIYKDKNEFKNYLKAIRTRLQLNKLNQNDTHTKKKQR